MENREIVRWTLVALSAYLGVTAATCPCGSIYSCHRTRTIAAASALWLITVVSANGE